MSARNRYLFSLILIGLALLTQPALSQNIVWSMNYGGSYNDEGYAGLQAQSGGYVIFGSSFLNGSGGFDFYLLRLNSAGDTIWSRNYGGADTEYGYDIGETGDGGLIMVGSTRSYGRGQSDVLLIRTDADGDTLWTKTFGGVGNDEGYAVEVTSDGGFIICGTTDSYGAGYTDIYMIRTDSLGDTLWTRVYGGTGGESGADIKQLSDNGFIAIGSTGSFGSGYSSLYSIRTNSDGDTLWTKTYGGNRADFGSAIELAYDGGFLFAGRTASFGAGFTDAYLVKTDSDGNVEWDQTYGDVNEDKAYSIYRAMDGGYILAGNMELKGARKTDIYVIKTDILGNMEWERTFGGSESDYGSVVFQEMGWDFIVVGHTFSFGDGGSDIYVIKIEGETTDAGEETEPMNPSGFRLAQNYPNPFNPSTSIDFAIPRRASVKLDIYNMLGQIVQTRKLESLPAGNHSVIWEGKNQSGSQVASGIYIYRISTNEFTASRKMTLIK